MPGPPSRAYVCHAVQRRVRGVCVDHSAVRWATGTDRRRVGTGAGHDKLV
jgi:hypothetical protein